MALSKNLLKAWRSVFPLRDFLYVLQLEEYETLPYLKSALRMWFRRGIEQRDHLRWTARAKATGALATLLWAVSLAIVSWLHAFIMPLALAVVVAIVVLGFAMPKLVGIAHLLLLPLSGFAKRRLCKQAQEHFARVGKDAKVIAIAGSYGKTTTRHFLYELLKEQYRTQIMPGNINTTMGIAQWILTKFDPSTQVVLVEMDAYHTGEIAASCKIVKPHVVVLTSIGDQHMVRFGTRANLAKAMQEVFAYARPDALRVTDAGVAKTLGAFGYTFDLLIVDDVMQYDGHQCVVNVSDSAKHDLAFALAVAKGMNVPARFVVDICMKLRSPDRRQQPGSMFGYDAIDDSYNISETTAHAGIAAARDLARQKGKKLLVLTAGIAELPEKESAMVNERYGAYIAEHADAAVVLESVYYKSITKGIDNRILLFAAPNLHVAVAEMSQKFPASEYVLLVQPEMTDLSY